MLRAMRRRSRQRGLAAPEMAIVTPFFILIFIGMWEVGWSLNQYDTLTKQVREAGRYLSYSAFAGTTQIIQLNQTMQDSGLTLTTELQNLVVYGVKQPTLSGNPNNRDEPVLPGLVTSDVAVSTVSETGVANTRHARIVASYTYQPVILQTLTLGFSNTLNFGVTMEASATVRAL